MIHLPDAHATEVLGSRLAGALKTRDQGLVIALEGELGAGKTTLARATITALGYGGVVVSPTYTLLESYPVAGRHLHHLDLYRLADAEELEFIGLRELNPDRDWLMVEWPERGRGHLPDVDLTLVLRYAGAARECLLRPQSEVGRAFVRALQLER